MNKIVINEVNNPDKQFKSLLCSTTFYSFYDTEEEVSTIDESKECLGEFDKTLESLRKDIPLFVNCIRHVDVYY